MAHASHPLPSAIYRPRKLPRVIRRQLPVLWLCVGIALAGALAVSITWRNLTYERLTLDVGMQRSRIEDLGKEIQHLSGRVEAERSFPRVSKWAREKHQWMKLPGHTAVIALADTSLSDAALKEAQLLSDLAHD